MNLHNIVAASIGAINPLVSVTVRLSNGYTIDSHGVQQPSYRTVTLLGQIQALTFRDIMQTNGLNLQGTRRAIYFNGDIEGLVRSQMKGGDLVTFPDGTVWLIAMALETWPDWCKVVATLQVS